MLCPIDFCWKEGDYSLVNRISMALHLLCLGKTDPFDVAGDPWTLEKNVLAC